MKHHLLLFDVDGTIMHTRGAGLRAMAHVGKRLFGPDFSMEGFNTSGMLDTVIFAELAEINGLAVGQNHHQQFREHYLDELEAELAKSDDVVQLLPGVMDLIVALRHRAEQKGDVMLGLLTGNYTGAIPIKFAPAGIDPDWFTVTAFAEDADNRPGLTEVAMRKYERLTGDTADPQRVIVIGDTPKDVQCAKAHGCVAFAVATGMYSVQDLRDAGADVVVESLADPAPLLRLLD